MNKLNTTMAVPSIEKKLATILKKRSFSSPYVIPFNQISFPIDIRSQYPGYLNYILEIGSGWGEFAIYLAKKSSDNIIFALEKKKKRVINAEKSQKKESLQNIRWMIIDINWFFDKIFYRDSFDQIIINFPDPWPKKKHHKHRFMNEALVRSLNFITKKGALFEFVSDSWSYIEEAISFLEKSEYWSNKYGEGVVLREITERMCTFYEKIQKKNGQNIYYLQYKKVL